MDPAARWLEHYDAMEERQKALGAAGRRHLRPRLPGLRRRQRVVATLIALSVVLVGAALAVLWR